MHWGWDGGLYTLQAISKLETKPTYQRRIHQAQQPAAGISEASRAQWLLSMCQLCLLDNPPLSWNVPTLPNTVKIFTATHATLISMSLVHQLGSRVTTARSTHHITMLCCDIIWTWIWHWNKQISYVAEAPLCTILKASQHSQLYWQKPVPSPCAHEELPLTLNKQWLHIRVSNSWELIGIRRTPESGYWLLPVEEEWNWHGVERPNSWLCFWTERRCICVDVSWQLCIFLVPGCQRPSWILTFSSKGNGFA